MRYFKGYSSFRNARSFRAPSSGFKKSFRKPYSHYKKHRSSNSATTSKGRYFKLVEIMSYKVDDFLGKVGTTASKVDGYLVLSTHAPIVFGPTPVTTPSGIGLTAKTIQSNLRFLKSFENCYLSKIKVTPLMNYTSDLKLVFEKNNVPITMFTDTAINYLSQP